MTRTRNPRTGFALVTADVRPQTMKKTFGTTEIAYPLLEIAKAAHQRFMQLKQEESQLGDPNNAAKMQHQWDLSHRVLSESVVTVVFTAIYLESFIYKYACNYMPLEYFDEHMDSLGAVSKWVVIPRMVDGKHMNTDSRGFKMLREVVRCRNRIVRSRIFSIDPEMKNIHKVNSHSTELNRCATNAMETICELLDTLKECVGDKFNGLEKVKAFCRQ